MVNLLQAIYSITDKIIMDIYMLTKRMYSDEF